MLKYFLNEISFFCPQKVEKTTLKSCSEKLKSTFFPYCPELPKRPKQKNLCSKMWPIDQLYIELGSRTLVECIANLFQFPSFRIKMVQSQRVFRLIFKIMYETDVLQLFGLNTLEKWVTIIFVHFYEDLMIMKRSSEI